jgi:hypothetical protein
VWQQGRAQNGLNNGSFELQRDYRDPVRGASRKHVPVKATYFFNP